MNLASALKTKWSIEFKDNSLLNLALTHSSFVHEKRLKVSESNERLEFLGDSVLNFCIAEMLVKTFPEEPEGALSKRLAALVNQKILSRLAADLGLGEALRLGKGEEKTGGRTKESIMGDAFEALVGAIYLDQGIEMVRGFLNKVFESLIPESKHIEVSQDYKTKLQEYAQRLIKKSPKYVLENTHGPDHSKTFEVRLEFAGEILGHGKGRSKREAEQDAARQALLQLKKVDRLAKARNNERVKEKAKKPKAQAGE
jgi:ribonuclease III